MHLPPLSYYSVCKTLDFMLYFIGETPYDYSHSWIVSILKKRNVEVGMDFISMVNALGDDKKAFRLPCRGTGKFLWKEGDVLVHNSPYILGDVIDPYLKGYHYVVTTEDVNSKDWVVMDK